MGSTVRGVWVPEHYILGWGLTFSMMLGWVAAGLTNLTDPATSDSMAMVQLQVGVIMAVGVVLLWHYIRVRVRQINTAR